MTRSSERTRDADVRRMNFAERGKEIRRLRSILRTHKKQHDNGRCWDVQLYEHTLPEGAKGMGFMDLPKNVLLRNCEKFIDRQKRIAHKMRKENDCNPCPLKEVCRGDRRKKSKPKRS